MYHLPYTLVWVKHWYFFYNFLITYNFQSNKQMFSMNRIFSHIGFAIFKSQKIIIHTKILKHIRFALTFANFNKMIFE
jgi:hypothetical protein